VTRVRGGYYIQCVPDPEDRYRTPNPMFYDPSTVGKSPSTWRVLWHLYNALPTDQHCRGMLTTADGSHSQFLISRAEAIIAATQDIHGEYGATVFVRTKSPDYMRCRRLFLALESDNMNDPERNAIHLCT